MSDPKQRRRIEFEEKGGGAAVDRTTANRTGAFPGDRLHPSHNKPFQNSGKAKGALLGHNLLEGGIQV